MKIYLDFDGNVVEHAYPEIGELTLILTTERVQYREESIITAELELKKRGIENLSKLRDCTSI